MSAPDFSPRTSRFASLRRLVPRLLRRRARRTEHLERRVFRVNPKLRDLLDGRQKIIILLVVVVLSAVIGLTQFAGYFSVTKVSVLRSSLDLPLAEIEAVVRDNALGKNIFQVNVTQIAKAVREARPDIAEVKVIKDYPDTLTVEVFKYPIIAELRIGTERIYLNEQGYQVVGDAPGRDVLTIMLGETIQLDDPTIQLITAKHLAAIRESSFYFEALTDLEIISIKYFPMAREAHLLTEKNFSVWLNLTTDTRTQLDKLITAKAELNLAGGKYEYIDLRVRNKIFYKPKR